MKPNEQTNSAAASLRSWVPCTQSPDLIHYLREGNCEKSVPIPAVFEKNVGQAGRQVEFVGRGKGFVVLLTQQGIEIPVRQQKSRSDSAYQIDHASAPPGVIRIRAGTASRIAWQGEGKLGSESNYFF
ncbi:MAG TPA: hypothetical protein VEU52_10820, partial [Candidatus Limnocylindrales bacterium]|nr:hypothetical protein [Candidatus Limnocylindrales bacterium]